MFNMGLLIASCSSRVHYWAQWFDLITCPYCRFILLLPAQIGGCVNDRAQRARLCSLDMTRQNIVKTQSKHWPFWKHGLKESCNTDYKQQVATGHHLFSVMGSVCSTQCKFTERNSLPQSFRPMNWKWDLLWLSLLFLNVWWKHCLLDRIMPAYILNPGTDMWQRTCWDVYFGSHGLDTLVSLGRNVTVNLYSVILADLPYPMVKHFYLNGSGLF